MVITLFVEFAVTHRTTQNTKCESLCTNVALSDCLQFDNPDQVNRSRSAHQSCLLIADLPHQIASRVMSLGCQSLRKRLAAGRRVGERVRFGLLQMTIVARTHSHSIAGPARNFIRVFQSAWSRRGLPSVAPARPEPSVRQVPDAADQVPAIGTKRDSRSELD
jgi:hypothetical protein